MRQFPPDGGDTAPLPERRCDQRMALEGLVVTVRAQPQGPERAEPLRVLETIGTGP